jgi:hypothetical protein
MIRDVVSFDRLRLPRRSLLASLASLNLFLEYSIVCRARRSTQSKACIRRALVRSLIYSRPKLLINPKTLYLVASPAFISSGLENFAIGFWLLRYLFGYRQRHYPIVFSVVISGP